RYAKLLIAEGKDRTRIELEHRRLDRYGAWRNEVRGIFDSDMVGRRSSTRSCPSGGRMKYMTNAVHPTLEKRQSVHHGWPVCRDKRTVGRIRCIRSERPEPCDPVDVKAPGREVGNRRDSPR